MKRLNHIHLEIQDAVEVLKPFQYTGAAKFKQIVSAQEAMKKHLQTLQHEIPKGYGTPGKGEHKSQDDETCASKRNDPLRTRVTA
jgi:hypothetical protein